MLMDRQSLPVLIRRRNLVLATLAAPVGNAFATLNTANAWLRVHVALPPTASPANDLGTPLTVALFAITDLVTVSYLLMVILRLGTYNALVNDNDLLDAPLPLVTNRPYLLDAVC